MTTTPIKGRGASWNPQNRFETLEYIVDDEAERDPSLPRTIYMRDPTRTLIATNDSPDVGFEASINPYRGCEHGCIYCFARPTHEYLGMSAGLDFETRILVKEDAPELLREELNAKSWEPKVIAISGVTDAFQPIERKLEITRRCLGVLAEFRNPVAIITKSHLVTRDIDHLQELAKFDAARVFISVTTVPAAGAMALSLALGSGNAFWEAAAQLGINLAGILVSATATLALQKALWRRVPRIAPRVEQVERA